MLQELGERGRVGGREGRGERVLQELSEWEGEEEGREGAAEVGEGGGRKRGEEGRRCCRLGEGERGRGAARVG